MALNLEKRLDGTFFFRRTYLKDGKQKALRVSLKTKSYKTAKILAIQILAGVEMDKLLANILSNPSSIKKLEVEYDDKRDIKKVVVNNDADKQYFLEVQESIEKQRQAEHQRTIELIKLQRQIPASDHVSNTTKLNETVISELLDEYISSSKITPDVLSKYKRVIGDFVAFCKKSEIYYLHQVTRKIANTYLKDMRNSGKEDKTIKNYFGVLNTFWNFQIKTGEIETLSPFSGHNFNIDEEAREPFTIEELNKIFASDFVIENMQNKFILLLLLTTGARPNEICQLWTDDVFQKIDESSGQPIWIIRITKNVKRGQTLKTKPSNRIIYLNDLLIQKGFIDYLQSKPLGMLFKLTKPTNKTWSAFFSSDFTDLLRNQLKIDNKVLYCFRHTANNRLKDKLVPSEAREDLLGQEQVGTNKKVYSIPHSPIKLKQLTEAHLFFDEVTSINNLN